MKPLNLISFHGGHSGQFCNHAQDSLEQIIQAYINKGFAMVGISEHIPYIEDRFLFPEEVEAGLSAQDIRNRFEGYFPTLEALSRKYVSQIKIFKGMETEIWPGYEAQVKGLVKTYRPDYIVGSVHHVNDRCFDYSKQVYQATARECGGIEQMYIRYFDLQYDMIQKLKPSIVGHFDLIRIFDPDYRQRIAFPGIQEKIQRNLALIRKFNLAMDLNLRPLSRGEDEPYPTRSILEQIKAAGIPMVPGDDAHSAEQAGGHVAQAIDFLKAMGFDTNWPIEAIVGV